MLLFVVKNFPVNAFYNQLLKAWARYASFLILTWFYTLSVGLKPRGEGIYLWNKGAQGERAKHKPNFGNALSSGLCAA
jgi:hypothetical protein